MGTEQTGLAEPGITVRTGTAVDAYWKRLFNRFHSSHTYTYKGIRGNRHKESFAGQFRVAKMEENRNIQMYSTRVKTYVSMVLEVKGQVLASLSPFSAGNQKTLQYVILKKSF